MGIVIGIDVGGSTTKIVGINGEQIQSPMFITATDPVTSLFGSGKRICQQPSIWTAYSQNGWVYCQWFGSQTCNGYRPTDCSQHGYRHFFCENRRRQGAAYWRLGDWWRYLAGIIEVAVENSWYSSGVRVGWERGCNSCQLADRWYLQHCFAWLASECYRLSFRESR